MQAIAHSYIVTLLGMLPTNPLSHNKALHDYEWTCIVIDELNGGLPLS